MMTYRAEPRRGVVLLEALIALSLISFAAVATVALARSDAEQAARLMTRSREMHRASDFLESASLWTRSELDARLGIRVQGPYLMRIARPSSALYTIELFDIAHDRRLLVTAVYRPEVSRATY